MERIVMQFKGKNFILNLQLIRLILIFFFSDSDDSSDDSEIDVRFRPSTSATGSSSLKSRNGKSVLNDSINLTTATQNNHNNNNNNSNNFTNNILMSKNNSNNAYDHDRDDNTPR